METDTIISVASLIVALLALPTSYLVAVRQAKVSIEEHERRTRKGARMLVADRLDDFFDVFYGAVRQLTGIAPGDLQRHLREIDPKLPEIDAFVGRTRVLERLAGAIEDLETAEYAGLPRSSDLVTRLRTIRANIARGSSAESGYATLNVIAAVGGVDLQSVLRSPS